MTLEKFLETSYTAYHTVENAITMLDCAGFKRWEIAKDIKLSVGDRYYLVKNGSTLVAFAVGPEFVFEIAESHTDSPSFKLKGDKPVISDNISRLNTERYGGALMYTFFDRPLKIAGRAIVEDNGKLCVRNVASDFNTVIPSLAIHHNPTANDSLSINAQTDALPLLGIEEACLYGALLPGEKIIEADLYAVPDQSPFYSGVNNEFLCSARIDNLTSVYASIKAICECSPKGITVAACFDNEETGSETAQGACSEFFADVLKALCRALGRSEREYLYARENGFVLSVDNAHATHPAHPEKYDPANRVRLNGGVVIKHNVNYATDAVSSAMVKNFLSERKIAFQDYYNRSDLRCGGTLGLITSTNLSMKACDVGLAQLAMHSACETIGSKDVELIQEFIRAFFDSDLGKI